MLLCKPDIGTKFVIKRSSLKEKYKVIFFHLHLHWRPWPSLWGQDCPLSSCIATSPLTAFDVEEDWVGFHMICSGIGWGTQEGKSKIICGCDMDWAVKSLTLAKRGECPVQCELWPRPRQLFQPFAKDSEIDLASLVRDSYSQCVESWVDRYKEGELSCTRKYFNLSVL